MRFINKVEQCEDFDNYILENNLDQYLENYINDVDLRTHPWKKFGNELNGRK